MSRLPVIVSMGGISPAGRSSNYHAYHRLVFDALPQQQQQQTLHALRALTGQEDSTALLNSTLVRRLESNHFDVEAVPRNLPAKLDGAVAATLRNIDLPEFLPDNWPQQSSGKFRSQYQLPEGQQALLPITEVAKVQAAGQLPSGFDPGALYASRNHPRALQMAIYGASDCVGSLGISWQTIQQKVAPHQIAVYASSAMSQLDDNGFGGMLKYPSQGKRITSKQCPLGFGEMAADFINAYVLGSLGRTGGMMGACATFLYNLSLGLHDIRSGRARVALVGAAEAPLVPEVFEGYRAMGALAEDAAILALDPGRTQPDWRRAVRPFGENCGFTLAESCHYFLLMDDALALELGADILGAVPDVFIHADGVKKSISAPGVGNYLTLGRSAALARQLLGEQALRERTFVSAHGTSTPKNRVTESEVLNRVAASFGIKNWPVNAVKAYLGHSLASASADQLMAALGTFNQGLLPGITTTHALADDVHREHLNIALQHHELEADAAFLNSKGFGGNNASALVLAPTVVQKMLAQKHGKSTLNNWQKAVDATREARLQYDQRSLSGAEKPVYLFGENVLADDALQLSAEGIQVPGWQQPIHYEQDEQLDSFALNK